MMEINKGELDRHITGNYGEDQFRGMDECPLTGNTECEHLDEHEIDDIQGTKPACSHPDVPSDTLIPLICPLKGDEPTVQQILTGLIENVMVLRYGRIKHYDIPEITFLYMDRDTQTAIAKAAEQIEQQREHKLGCPCLHIAPCKDSCTCANPVMSGGCRRCASYGSEEQQVKAAMIIAGLIDNGQQQRERAEKLRTALSTAFTWPDGEPVSTQGVLSLSVTALRDEGHKSLAFELEAVRDDQKAALKELEATDA